MNKGFEAMLPTASEPKEKLEPQLFHNEIKFTLFGKQFHFEINITNTK
jgi:hypothetical protein